jgi:class 3 adenylate cyclase/tetratricopeptide (TPR) repeat protein
MVACPNCGQENPEGFRLCGMCGTALAARTDTRETRKVVSILFADVAGSTALGERLDPEPLRQVMSRFFEATSAAIDRHGGTVEKYIGDAVMAVFGIPLVHEDDALRAVRAAAEVNGALGELSADVEKTHGVRIEARIGINTGEVVAGNPSAGERFATGDPVNVAARLEQSAGPGEILVGAVTYGLVRDAVQAERVDALALRGKGVPVTAFRILGVTAGAPGHARRLDTSLVGRTRELELMRDAFARATRDRVCHFFTLLGLPGVGKSRLVAEFLALVGDEAQVASGRCLPYGDGITFHPMVESVRDMLGLGDRDGAEAAQSRLADVLADEPSAETVGRRVLEVLSLAEASASTEELFWALRKLVEAVARRRPLVLVLDDVHWGEPTFLDFVEHLADWSRDAPTLLLCTARPELLALRPSWGGGKLNATTVLLQPLDATETDALLVELLAGGELDSASRSRIGAAAEGNPLFVEELVGMLIDDGVLVPENGRWSSTGDLSAVPVPPSIQALLAARLDQLGTTERIVIERAAVEGQVFHAGAVAALVPDQGAVGASLMELVRRELIRPERPIFPGEEAFRFRHLLIRDAAYDALPKRARAELHERFADWLEEKAGERGTEVAEIAGYHLEQACRYCREVSPGQPQTTLTARAAAHLTAAGRRTYTRGDMPAAANLLGRAAALLPQASEERLDLLPLLGAALAESGRLLDARAVLAEAVDLAGASGNARIEWRARTAEGWWRQNMDHGIDLGELEALARRAIGELEVLGDDFGLASAWRLLSDIANSRGDGVSWIEGLERAFVYARRAGNRSEEWGCLSILGGAMYFGPTPADEGASRLEGILAEIGEDLLLESAISRPLGGLIAIQGRLEEGRALIERSRAIQADLGLAWGLAGVAFVVGNVGWLTGDLETAEQETRAGIAAYADMGERGRQSSLIVQLADIVYDQGRIAEAGRLAEEAAAIAAADDVQPNVGARRIRGRVLARNGELAEGERLVREAVALSETTDFLDVQTVTRLDLAEVLTVADRAGEARPLIEQAIALARRKGNVLLERRAEGRLAQLG